MSDLNELLSESLKLDAALQEFIPAVHPSVPKRERCSAILCSVVFEHAESIKMLLASWHFTSAVGLLRLQYESLVRALWIHHAASDNMVEKLLADLTADSARVANKLPMLREMLDALEGKAHPNALRMLTKFRESSWRPLSSFVHGGIHTIERKRRGYPEALLIQELRASNGLSVLAGIQMAALAENLSFPLKINSLQQQFKACLPPHHE